MTAIANIVVKKADNTTDITWTAISGSGGDKSPALWRSLSAPGTVGQLPYLTVSTRSNADKTVRRVDVTGVFPSVYTNTNTGQTEVRGTCVFTGSFAVPQNIAAADINEAAWQILNLLATSLVKGSVTSGYAPT
jgi:hypothetical protein